MLGLQRPNPVVGHVGLVIPRSVKQQDCLGDSSNLVPELLLSTRHGPALTELSLVGTLRPSVVSFLTPPRM